MIEKQHLDTVLAYTRNKVSWDLEVLDACLALGRHAAAQAMDRKPAPPPTGTPADPLPIKAAIAENLWLAIEEINSKAEASAVNWRLLGEWCLAEVTRHAVS